MKGQRNNSTRSWQILYDGTNKLTWKRLVSGNGIRKVDRKIVVQDEVIWLQNCTSLSTSANFWRIFEYMMVHYMVSFPASYNPFYATPLSSCQRTYFESTTRACFTRGCWHVITKIFGLRTLLTTQILDPNRNPQYTNSTCKFESNFISVFPM